MIIAVLLLLIFTLTMYLPTYAVYNCKFAQFCWDFKKETTYQSLKHPCDVNEGYSSHTKDEKKLLLVYQFLSCYLLNHSQLYNMFVCTDTLR